MIIEAFFEQPNIKRAVNDLGGLPSNLRPVRYSADEDGEKYGGKIEEDSKFREFATKYEYGFFLFAEDATYNVNSRSKSGFCTIEVESRQGDFSEQETITILKTFARSGSAFGFAAHPEEYDHRNRYVRTLGANQFEAWVGRDLRRYLPGIYWMTLFSQEHSNALSTISSDLAFTITKLDTDHWLVKAFESAAEWRRNAPRLDEWLESQPGFFSKRRIQAQLDEISNILSLSEAAGKWR